METADLHPLVEDLASNIDDLEESLAPLLKTALSHSTSKLPLLDKAKLYVLATYAIESILFSSLRLSGVNAKAHPVFQELARVKEYFSKIKTAESRGQAAREKRNGGTGRLDKDAASRFVKHGLAGNERLDRERAERVEREKAGAKRKFEDVQFGTHTRFEGAAKRAKAVENERSPYGNTGEMYTSEQDSLQASAPTTDAEASSGRKSGRKSRDPEKQAAKRRRKADRRIKQLGVSEGSSELVGGGEADDGDGSDGEDDDERGEGSNTSQRAPKSSKEALEALLDLSAPPDPGKKKHKRKRKDKGQKLEDERAEEMK